MSRLRTTLLLSLLPAAALAATPIDQTRPLSPGAHVEIENVKGRIQVRTWDRAEAHIAGSLGEGVEKLVVEGGGDRLQIRVEYPQSGGWFGWGGDRGGEPTNLEITLPQRLGSLDVGSVSAEIDVEGTEGEQLDVASVSGDIRVAAAADEASVESVSGDQDLRLAGTRLSAESVSGDVRVHGTVSGRVHAEAVSGDIDVEAGQLDSFSASTVSGDVGVVGTLAPGGRLRIEALSGDVTVQLPKATSARITASSFSGSIRSDVGTVDEPEYGPGSSLEATAGSGEGEIQLETFSGEIDLRLR